MSRRSDNHWQKRLIPQRIRSANQTLAKISRNARQNSNQGFALPMALGMGLIMLLVGVTMILRSQDDQVTASAQKATGRSLSVSETGITRVQAFFKRFPKTASKNRADWQAEYDRVIALKSCLANDEEVSLIDGDWINVDSSDLNKGEFRIRSYTLTDNEGTLKVEGRARSENGSTNTSVDNSTSLIEVKIPITPSVSFPVPGLWARDFNMGNNDVSGDILVNGCSIPPNISEDNIIPGTGSLTANPYIGFPDLPNLLAVCPLAGSASQPCYQIQEPITNTYIRQNAATETECLKDEQGYVVKEDNQGELERVREKSINITECTEPEHYNETKNLLFPKPGDKAGSEGIYRYLITPNNDDSIRIKGGNRLKITEGQKVVFYLQGNITMTGQSKIVHTGTPATNFQIYGSDGGRNYKILGDSRNYITDSISLSGNTSANMFVYAPQATVGVNGGGNQVSSIIGSVWAKTWDGSSANQLVITQNADWTNLPPVLQPNQISSINTWQRTAN